jgi:methionyl-tRNA synthetase
VATWGNLVNRSVSLAHKHFGTVPPPGPLTPEDEAVRAATTGGFAAVGDLIGAARFKAALAETMALAGAVNAYVSQQEPWALVKADKERAATVLNVALSAVADLSVLFTPFLPHSSEQVRELLGLPAGLGPEPEVGLAGTDGQRVLRTPPPDGRWGPVTLEPGAPVGPARPLFAKLDPSIVDEELRRLDPGT